MMLHIEFKTHNDLSYNIMEYLKHNGFRPALAVSENIDGNCSRYLIICYGGKEIMEQFDTILVKLTTGADLIKYWEVDETKYA